MLAEGAVLKDRYQILRVLSEKGGMGVVYQATDLIFNHTVVLKQSRFPAGEKRLGEAFEREARLLNGLRHGALPHVSDYFISEDGQFLVMQFIPGKDLGELLDERLRRGEGPFPVTQVLRWADQLLDALDYLHTHQPPVIHRDIKPQNLKLTPRGEIVLLDFGLAKGAAAGTAAADVSVHGYTPTYAPLEQIRGTGTDERSDLYSLAATLHHLLTGVVTPDAVSRVTETISGASDPLRPPHELNPSIPLPVSMIIHCACALSAADRPPSAAAMRDELRKAAGDRVTVAAPVTAPNSPRPTAPAAAETTVAGTAIATGAAAPASTAASAPAATATSPVSSRRGLRLGALALVIVAALAGAGVYLRYLRSSSSSQGAPFEVLDKHEHAVLSVAFSPSGKLLASGNADETIKVWDYDSRSLIRVFKGDDADTYAIAFSPDEKLLASAHQYNSINLWDIRAGALKQSLEGHTNVVSSIAFSPNGKTLASGSWDDTIRLWEVATGTHLRTISGHDSDVLAIAYSPNGRVIASGSWDSKIKLWDEPTGILLNTLEGHQGAIRAIAFSPNGALLASGSMDDTIRLWDPNTGRLIKTLDGLDSDVLTLAFSADGRTLAGGYQYNQIVLWDLPSGTRRATLTGHEASVLSVAFSPDGGMLASSSRDRTLRLWNLTPSREGNK